MGGGGQEDLSEPENFFCLFLEQENFFCRIIFLKPSRALFIKPWGGGVNIQILHFPNFFPEFFFLPLYHKYYLFIMQKGISQVKCTMGVSKAVYRVRKANFGLRKQISDCEKRILECENRFRSAKALPKLSRIIFFAGPSGRRIFFT